MQYSGLFVWQILDVEHKPRRPGSTLREFILTRIPEQGVTGRKSFLLLFFKKEGLSSRAAAPLFAGCTFWIFPFKRSQRRFSVTASRT